MTTTEDATRAEFVAAINDPTARISWSDPISWAYRQSLLTEITRVQRAWATSPYGEGREQAVTEIRRIRAILAR